MNRNGGNRNGNGRRAGGANGGNRNAPVQQRGQRAVVPVKTCAHLKAKLETVRFTPEVEHQHGYASSPLFGDEGMMGVGKCGQLKLLLVELLTLINFGWNNVENARIVILGGSPGQHLPVLKEKLEGFFGQPTGIQFIIVDPRRPSIAHQRFDAANRHYFSDQGRLPHDYMWFEGIYDIGGLDANAVCSDDLVHPTIRGVFNDVFANKDYQFSNTITNQLLLRGINLIHGKWFCSENQVLHPRATLIYQPFVGARSSELRATTVIAERFGVAGNQHRSDNYEFVQQRLFYHQRFRRLANQGSNKCFDCTWLENISNMLPVGADLDNVFKPVSTFEYRPDSLFKVPFRVSKDLKESAYPAFPIMKGDEGRYHAHGDEAAIRLYLHNYALYLNTTVNGFIVQKPKYLDFGGGKRMIRGYDKVASYDLEFRRDLQRKLSHGVGVPCCVCGLRINDNCHCSTTDLVLTQDKIYYPDNQNRLARLIEHDYTSGRHRKYFNIFMVVEEGTQEEFPKNSGTSISCKHGEVRYSPFGNEAPYVHDNYEVSDIREYTVDDYLLDRRVIFISEKIHFAARRGPFTYYICEWQYIKSDKFEVVKQAFNSIHDWLLEVKDEVSDCTIVSDDMLHYWFVHPNRKDWRKPVKLPVSVMQKCSAMKYGLGTALGSIHSATQGVGSILTEWNNSMHRSEQLNTDTIVWLSGKIAAHYLVKSNNNVYQAAVTVNSDEGSRLVNKMIKEGGFASTWHHQKLLWLYTWTVRLLFSGWGALSVAVLIAMFIAYHSYLIELAVLVYVVLGFAILCLILFLFGDDIRRTYIKIFLAIGFIKPVAAYQNSANFDIGILTFMLVSFVLLVLYYLKKKRQLTRDSQVLFSIPRRCISDKQKAALLKTDLASTKICRLQCDKPHVCDPAPRPKTGVIQVYYTWASIEQLLPPIAFHHCSWVECCALKTRQLKMLPEPDKKLLKLFGEFSSLLNDHLLRNISSLRIPSVDEWVRHFPGRKRAGIENSLKHHVGEFKHKNSKIVYDGFPKMDEKAINDGLKEARPRWVSGPKNWNKIVVGPFFYGLSLYCEKYLPGYCVTKTFSEVSTSLNKALLEFRDPVAFLGDGSSFDSCQSRGILEVSDLDLYNKVLDSLHVQYGEHFVSAEDIRRCVNWIDHIGFAKHHTYSLRGRVPSGKSNTTEGNTRREASYMIFICWAAGILKHCYIICKGDDVIVLLERKHIARFEAYRRQFYTDCPDGNHGLGQVMVEGYYSEVDGMDFCSARFMKTSKGYRMIRMPERVIKLDSWCINPQVKNQGDARAQIWAVGHCGLDWAKGVPIFESWYRSMIRNGKVDKRVLTEMREAEQWKGLSREGGGVLGDIDIESRIWFEKYYGVSVSEQVYLEAKLDNLVFGCEGSWHDDVTVVWRLGNPCFPDYQQHISEISVPPVSLVKTIERKLHDNKKRGSLAAYLRGVFITPTYET